MSWDAPYPEWPLPKRNVGTPLPELFNQDADAFGGDVVSQNEALANIINPPPAKPANPSDAIIDALTQQILGQGTSSKWTGAGMGSAEANARDMARILAGIGITDIKQFGRFTQKGLPEEVRPDGRGGFVDSKGNLVDPSLVTTETQSGESGEWTTHTAPVGTQEVYGNKETGQAVPITYSERQTGNAWGGTFAGEGNTGYRVMFGDDGTPYFYTTGASSNTLATLMQDLGPMGQIAFALATGGLSIPQQIAAKLALNVLSGQDFSEAIKSAAISMAVANIPGTQFMKDGASFIKDLGLDDAVTKTLTNSFQNAVTSGARAVLTGKDIGDAMLNGAVTGGVNGAVNVLMNSADMQELTKDLSATQKRLVANAITGAISGKPLDQIVINAAIAAANAEAKEQAKYKPLSDEDRDYLSPELRKIYDEGGTKALKDYQRAQILAEDKAKAAEAAEAARQEELRITAQREAEAARVALETENTRKAKEAEDARIAKEIEAARLAKEEADRLAREATNLKEAEAARKAKEEADRLAKEAEAARKADEEARAAKEAEIRITAQREAEAARLAEEDRVTKQTEADRVAKEIEAARLSKEAEDARIAKAAEAARLAKEEAERMAREAKNLKDAEDARKAKEEAARLAKEAELLIVAQRDAEAARLAEEERINKQTEADRVAKEIEAARLAKEAADKKAADEAALVKSLETSGLKPKETVTVTGKNNTCPVGTIYNPATDECEPIVDTSIGTSTTTTTPPPVTPPPVDKGTVTVVDKKCQPGYVYDEDLKMCVPIEGTDTGTGTTSTTTTTPTPVDKGTVTVTGKRDPCPPGTVYDEVLDACVPIVDDKGTVTITGNRNPCPPGTVYDEVLDACVPITTTPPATTPPATTPPKVTPPATTSPVTLPAKTTPPTRTTAAIPSFIPTAGANASTETTNPIYAGEMGDFNLFSTLEELLAADQNKKDSTKAKDKTKMATGGHLDDLLAQQMSVDDLLNLLR